MEVSAYAYANYQSFYKLVEAGIFKCVHVYVKPLCYVFTTAVIVSSHNNYSLVHQIMLYGFCNTDGEAEENERDR